MRFYLDFVLVSGYVLMATTACIGMLQLVAARGGYAGLSLFASEHKSGSFIGSGLTVGALLAYVLVAPEILTPGPAGSEVAAMFAGCALLALFVTVLGSDQRLKRAQSRQTGKTGEPMVLGSLPCFLHRSIPSPIDSREPWSDGAPILVLIPDPTDLVYAPRDLIESLCSTGIAVVAMDRGTVSDSEAPLLCQQLLGHLSAALAELALLPGIDHERVGLLGLGLGGDAALSAAAVNPRIRCAVAVSPVISLKEDLAGVIPGLLWLREISYLQAWRLRRLWPALKKATADRLGLPARQIAPENTAILYAVDHLMTTRNSIPVLSAMPVPSDRHFTLLEESAVREQLVKWLTGRLTNND